MLLNKSVADQLR